MVAEDSSESAFSLEVPDVPVESSGELSFSASDSDSVLPFVSSSDGDSVFFVVESEPAKSKDSYPFVASFVDSDFSPL